MQEITPSFRPCWQAAGEHLDAQVSGGIQSWLRAHPYPPFLEHLSFRLGNQLFFVRVEDVDGQVHGPGGIRGLHIAAKEAAGHACLLPMRKSMVTGAWEAALSGWGLVDARTLKPIDPYALVTDEKIEMTLWEVHDMAVQVVLQHLKSEGFKMMSWQGSPHVDPSIWFVGESKRPEWVVVRPAVYPETKAQRPANWSAIAQSCAKLSPVGHFASVSLICIDQLMALGEDEPMRLWRGHGMSVRFEGLESP